MNPRAKKSYAEKARDAQAAAFDTAWPIALNVPVGAAVLGIGWFASRWIGAWAIPLYLYAALLGALHGRRCLLLVRACLRPAFSVAIGLAVTGVLGLLLAILALWQVWRALV